MTKSAAYIDEASNFYLRDFVSFLIKDRKKISVKFQIRISRSETGLSSTQS
jgi:hypothetical protein